MSKERSIEADEQRTDLTFREWQEALKEGQLLGQKCVDCSQVTTFPRGACDHCGSRDLEVTELPTTGEVYSETTVNVAPEGFEGGYRLALVDLDGAHILARVADDVEIGDAVTFTDVFEQEGDPAPVFESEM